MLSQQLSQDLIYWGRVLEAAHRIAEVVRQMESTREASEAVLKLAKQLELSDIKLQEAIVKLERGCLPTNAILCDLGGPLKEQHCRLEACYRRIIATNEITSERISEIEDELCESIKVCKEYQGQLDKLLQDMTRVRELFELAMANANQLAGAADLEASSSRSRGYFQSAAFASIAGILGISFFTLGAPVAAAAASAAAVGIAGLRIYTTQLSARSLEERALKFCEASATLQSYADTFKELIEKTSTGPVILSEDLRNSLSHVLQLYSKYHEKEDEADKLRQNNAELQSQIHRMKCERSLSDQSKDDEIERLNRKIARLTANEKNIE